MYGYLCTTDGISIYGLPIDLHVVDAATDGLEDVLDANGLNGLLPTRSERGRSPGSNALSVQPQAVLLEGRASARRCGRAEVLLVEGYGEGRVRGEEELGVSLQSCEWVVRGRKGSKHLSPVLQDSDVDGSSAGGVKWDLHDR